MTRVLRGTAEEISEATKDEQMTFRSPLVLDEITLRMDPWTAEYWLPWCRCLRNRACSLAYLRPDDTTCSPLFPVDDNRRPIIKPTIIFVDDLSYRHEGVGPGAFDASIWSSVEEHNLPIFISTTRGEFYDNRPYQHFIDNQRALIHVVTDEKFVREWERFGLLCYHTPDNTNPN